MSETCQPHQVSKVYYRVLSEEQVAAIAEEGKRPSVDMDGVPFYFVAYAEDEITTVVDVSDYVEAKLRGIRCHITQVGRATPFDESVAEARRDLAFQQESFVLAQSTVGRPDELETDLLWGIG
jgi:LmbE family N-acetylglucosaminyl deacetylase